jgi:hypothetical protein
MIQKTSAETAYDAAHASCTPPANGSCTISRIVLWPRDLIGLGLPDGGGWLIFVKGTNDWTRTNNPCYPGPGDCSQPYVDTLAPGTTLGEGAAHISASDIASSNAHVDRSTSVSPVACAGGAATPAGCLFDDTIDPSVLDEFRHVVVDGGFVYLFSSDSSGNAKLARAPLAQKDTPGQWRYWIGPTASDWSTSNTYSQAATITGVSVGSISYNPVLDKWVNLSQLFANMSLQTADNLTGPWSTRQTIEDISAAGHLCDTDFGHWPRTSQAHRELFDNGQRLVAFSYFRPGKASTGCPDQHRWASVKIG